MVEQLMAFVLTCLVVVLVPGPDFAFVLRNAARGRQRQPPPESWRATRSLPPWPCPV